MAKVKYEVNFLPTGAPTGGTAELLFEYAFTFAQ